MKKSTIRNACAGLLMFGMIAAIYPAAASMLLLPVRVYFKDGERMKGLTVLNKGDTQAVFSMKFEHKKQLAEGGYEALTEPLTPGYDPSKWLVYSPRQVSLEPQGRQGVRLSLRRPADIPAGEYRVHMALDRTARERIERGPAEPGKSTTKFMVNVGFSVPVIIRIGKNDAVAEIKSYNLLPPDVKAQDKRPRLMVDIARSGKFSTVGEVTAFWTPPGGDEVKVGQQKGVIIYPELAGRTARVFLDQPISGGTLRIVYSGIEVDRGTTFDERIFNL